MKSTSICYVTMFLDIGRSDWKNVFTRTFEQYLKDFEPFIPLFNKKSCNDDLLFVFIDKKCENKLKDKINSYSVDNNKFNITVLAIDNEFMNLLPMWKTLNKEREIMNSIDFKNTVGWRHIYPEHIFPEYTLINHCKIDVICSLIVGLHSIVFFLPIA